MSEQAPRRAGLALGATLVAAMALLVGVLTAGEDRQQVATPTSTTTTTASAVIRETGVISIGDKDLRRADLALFGGGHPESSQDDEVVLVTFDGTELGRGPRGGWYTNDLHLELEFAYGGGSVTLSEGMALDDPVPGCSAVHGAGGVRAAVCGPREDTDEIRLIGSDGRFRVLSGPVAEVGHWRFALPSPDGRWVLAQWSAECEVPVTYLVRVQGGRRRPVVSDATYSTAIGWSPGGRAIVGLAAADCGAPLDHPGTYLVEPNSLGRRRMHAYSQGARITGPRVGNRLERVMARAHDELGLEYCCNQPSHGGGDAEAGFVFKGTTSRSTPSPTTSCASTRTLCAPER